MHNNSITSGLIKRPFNSAPINEFYLEGENRNAAVAMIFHENDAGLHLCFGKRAEFDGDPWSGDMAFPGGKAEPQDQTFHDIARREAFEEVGLTLGRNELIGSLDILTTFSSNKRPSLTLRPMIYLKSTRLTPFVISEELDAAYWIPVAHLWNQDNWVSDYVQWNGRSFPGIQFEGQVIWGLTLRILFSFAEKIQIPLATTSF